MQTNKMKGAIAEFLVITELLKKDFVVSQTQGEYVGYDIISDWQGKLNRIQIKATFVKHKDKRKRMRTEGYSLTIGRGNSSKTKYTSIDCDFLIIFTPEAYYIIPITAITVVKISLYPSRNNIGRWEKYRNRWDLLKT